MKLLRSFAGHLPINISKFGRCSKQLKILYIFLLEIRSILQGADYEKGTKAAGGRTGQADGRSA